MFAALLRRPVRILAGLLTFTGLAALLATNKDTLTCQLWQCPECGSFDIAAVVWYPVREYFCHDCGWNQGNKPGPRRPYVPEFEQYHDDNGPHRFAFEPPPSLFNSRVNEDDHPMVVNTPGADSSLLPSVLDLSRNTGSHVAPQVTPTPATLGRGA